MKGSIQLYRALLHLYPASFRAEYGDEMCAIFTRQCAQAFAPLFWLRTIFETVFNAAACTPPSSGRIFAIRRGRGAARPDSRLQPS